MITPLRRRHRWLAPGAFGVGLIGLCVALGARPSAFVDASSNTAVPAFDRPEGALEVQDEDGRFTIVWTPPTEDDEGSSAWLVPHVPLAAPDLLVYLVEDLAEGSSGVPPGAVFLGPAHPEHPTRLPLPTASTIPGTSSFLLYSLAHQSRFASLPWVASSSPKGAR